jgi:hypothetical protein
MTQEFKPEYYVQIPTNLEDGIIYISERFGIAIHLCACGCKGKTVTPFGSGQWTLTKTDGKVTLRPSIGNWAGENPYHAHYFITDNKVQFV